ncbi:MAG TPA: reverse transcriptase/maturase family protein [Candidatus Paceibacterota bacterium]
MKNKIIISYLDIISVQNLYEAWEEFLPGKKKKEDVAEFALNLSSNILKLHSDLVNRNYTHGAYKAFNISDPKPRNIHKASVRDRLLHHAIYKILYPYFDRLFIFDSYSCRVAKGTHKAIERFKKFGNQVSKSNTKTCWVLKCDIRKFFASINHKILLDILKKYIKDREIIWLLERIILSFFSTKVGVGLPLGNLTSQLLVNIYMNEFDQYIKHILKIRHYIRYADDFVFLDTDKDRLLELIPRTADFLDEHLKLQIHPDKLFIRTLASGLDFLGWVHFPKYRVLRTVTKRRMFKRIKEVEWNKETVGSYLGMLRWGDNYNLEQIIEDEKSLH